MKKKKKMIQIFNNDLKFLIPEIYLVVSILGLLMFGVLITKENTYEKQLMITKLSILSLIGYLILILNNPFPTQAVVLCGLLYLNSFNLFIKSIIVIASIVLLFMSYDYIKNEDVKNYELTILILLSVLGMILLVCSYDLLSLYLGIELQSLAFYILAAFKRNTIASTEAGLKYFILGSLSSGILLLGMVIVYGLTGTTSFELFYLLDANTMSTGIIVGFHCIAIALFFKLAAAPFHMWAPDVYEGSPTIITALFAAISKLPILAIIIQLFNGYLTNIYPYMNHIVILVSLASMFVGAIGALGQFNIKRLLAYSSILNVGYMLLGLSVGNTQGVQMTILFAIIYMVVSLNLFSFLLSLRTIDNQLIKNINDLAGLSKSHPLLAFNVSLSFFSLIGVPPLAGFISKYFLLKAVMDSAWPILTLVAVITTVIAAVYYLRVVKIMYFDTPTKPIQLKEINFNLGIVLSVTGFITLFFLFNPNLIMILIEGSLFF